jgi:O-antigen ligase
MPRLRVTDRVPAWSVWLLLAVPLLLPISRLAEAPVLLGGLMALVWWRQGRLSLPPTGRSVALAGFGAYWLAQTVSAIDAVQPARVLQESLVDLRYLPWLLFALAVLADAERARRVLLGLAVLVGLWSADALVQALSGWSLGGPATADRLSGIFGADNLKLGPTLASLAPFALLPLARRHGWTGLLGGALLLGIVVLLAGARAGWVSYALVLGWLIWRQAEGGWRGAAALGMAAALGLATAFAAAELSPRFAERLARTGAALEGDSAGIDHALSGRLPIWAAAWRMFTHNPVNGVGVRGFRHAYAEHAPPDDVWLQEDGTGAFHAHQIVLELLSETGLLGLLLWLAATGIALRCWWRLAPAARQRVQPAAVALVVTVFPLNTHFAVYSSYWGGVLLLLLALFAGLLGTREPDQSL